ncbi:MAG: DHA2 family efflux MFS transporter permease subunit [Solirubrobacterales bacterium]|nr:DHA2 family efflux MFS transporter permease subunit [Solirubrobacterales bacterium]
MAFLDATIVNIAFPSLQSSFPGVARAWLSWVLNGYNIIFAALLVPAGRLADLVGRRRVFFAGVLVFGVASLVCAAASSAAVLVLVRALQALGAALLVPTALGLLLDAYPLGERVRAIAILGAAAALAAASGPVFGGLLVEAFGWRAVFVVNLPICLLTLYLIRRWVPESRDPSAGSIPDAVGIVLFTASMALLALGLTRQEVWGWGDIRVSGSLALGAVAFGLFVFRSRRHPAPAVELTLFARGRVGFANLATTIFGASFYAKILIDVLFLTSIWGYSVLGAGLAMTPGPLITAIVAAPAGRLADRFGTGPTAAAGGVVYAVACAWYALRAGTTADYLGVWLPGAVLTGVGMALAFPSLTSAAVTSLSPSRYSTGSAVNSAARQMGGVLGIAIAVSIIGGTTHLVGYGNYVNAWTYAAVTAAVAAAAAVGIGLRGEGEQSSARAPA